MMRKDGKQEKGHMSPNRGYKANCYYNFNSVVFFLFVADHWIKL